MVVLGSIWGWFNFLGGGRYRVCLKFVYGCFRVALG